MGISKETRKKMGESQKKRWEAYRAKKEKWEGYFAEKPIFSQDESVSQIKGAEKHARVIRVLAQAAKEIYSILRA